MTTYVLLGALFLAGIALADRYALRTRVLARRSTLLAVAVLLAFTAVFDNILTGLPIVTYNDSLTLGIRLGYAPIEDFMYTLGAVVFVPAVYRWLGRRHG